VGRWEDPRPWSKASSAPARGPWGRQYECGVDTTGRTEVEAGLGRGFGRRILPISLILFLTMTGWDASPDTAIPGALRSAQDVSPGPRREAQPVRIRFGLVGGSAAYLPFFLAEASTFRQEGLNVELVHLGATGVGQALVGGSIDLAATTLSTVLAALVAGHSVRVFYGGFRHADVQWFARPGTKGWPDLRGGIAAVSSQGGLVDFLTSVVLRKHGLEPHRDVRMMLLGGPADRFAALRAGRVDVAALQPPFTWMARDVGLHRLGTQVEELGPEWPRVVLWARTRFLDEFPNTVRAVLRAHVRAIRLAAGDRELSVEILKRRLKYAHEHAERAYDEIIGGLDERGNLPARGMALFWDVAIAAGEVDTPWPEARFLDRQFISTFENWAPDRRR
jgi:ABC-type nitrate/sulfonate/bicarbonate transport system substrate-binding protein